MIGFPGLPSPYLWAGLFLAGVAAGGYGMNVKHKADERDALQASQAAERGLQRTANQADVRYVDRLHAQAQRAQDNAKAFQEALHATNNELAACRVGAELLGVLDAAGKLPGAAGHPAEPGPPAARAEAAPGGGDAGGRGLRAPGPGDSTAGRELDACRANYAEVCVPNAIHLRELRAFTRKLIGDYNQAIGKE